MLDSHPGDEPDGATLKRTVWNGALALVDQAFVSLNTFVTLILVAQFCDRSDVNLYALAWPVLNVFRVIQERALTAPYVMFAHERGRNMKTFLGSSLSHQSLFALTTSFLLVIVAIFFSLRAYPAGMSGCMWMLVGASPFVLLRDHLRAISCAHFRYGIAVMLSVSAMILQIAIILILKFIGRLNVEMVFLAMGVASLIPCIYWLLLRPQPFGFDRRQIQTDWKTTSSYSKWLVAARTFPSIAASMLPWIVLWTIDENASGILMACMQLANISMMFVFGSNNFFLPRAVKALHDQGLAAMIRILKESVVVYSLVLSILCGTFFALGDWIMGLAFGEEFVGYSLVAGLLGLNVLIVSYSMIAGNGMAAIGKPQGLFWGELAFGVVAVIMAILLSPLWGLMGTSIALCLASLAATVVETAMLMQMLRAGVADPIAT